MNRLPTNLGLFRFGHHRLPLTSEYRWLFRTSPALWEDDNDGEHEQESGPGATNMAIWGPLLSITLTKHGRRAWMERLSPKTGAVLAEAAAAAGEGKGVGTPNGPKFVLHSRGSGPEPKPQPNPKPWPKTNAKQPLKQRQRRRSPCPCSCQAFNWHCHSVCVINDLWRAKAFVNVSQKWTRQDSNSGREESSTLFVPNGSK